MRLHAADWQFWLDDRSRILRLAWLPYPQLRPDAWQGACEGARAAGVHGLLVPISWEHHAPAPDVLDLDGSTAARRDLSRLLAIIADADLGLVPVADAARLPAWLRGANGERPSLWDQEYQDAVRDWHEAVVQTVAAIAPDATLLWALAEPPGPDRAAAAVVTTYQSWLATRYDDPLDLAREWQRDVESFQSVAAPGPGAVPAEQRDWQLFGVSARAGTLSRLAQPIREYLPEVSTALLVPDTRQALARAVQLQSVTDDASLHNPISHSDVVQAGASPDLLATVAADEPSVVAQLNALALDEWRPATVWQQPTITRLRNETAGPVQDRALWRQSMAALARGSRSLGWTVAAAPGRGIIHDAQGAINRTATAALGEGDRAGAGGPDWSAVAPVARFLDSYEELLVRSTPVYDPLVVLWDGLSELVTAPDEALAESGSGQLLTLLGTAGWQPECLDLSTLDDETLGEFRAAIIIGHGYLDLEAYGRLVVYAVGGGHVLTVGRPIYADESGRRINTRLLYPRPMTTRSAPSERSAGHHRRLWQRLRTLFRGQPPPLFGTESSKVPLANEPLAFEAGPGDDLWWQWHGSRRGPTVAYRAAAHRGSTTVIGAPLQPPSARSAADGTALRRLIADLLEPLVPRRLVPEPHLALDLALRQVETGEALLIASNPGPTQRGTIRLRSLAALGLGLGGALRAEVIAAAGESTAHIEDDGSTLSVVVDAGDALVVRLR